MITRLVAALFVASLVSACAGTSSKKPANASGPWITPDTKTRILFEDISDPKTSEAEDEDS